MQIFTYWGISMSILAKLYYWANFSHISVVYNNQGSFLPKAIWPSCVVCCPAAWFHVFTLTPWLNKQPLCGTSPVLWQRENILWITCQFFELPFRNGTYHFLLNFSLHSKPQQYQLPQRIFFSTWFLQLLNDILLVLYIKWSESFKQILITSFSRKKKIMWVQTKMI